MNITKKTGTVFVAIVAFSTACKIRLTYKHDLGEPYNPAIRTGKAPALQPFVNGASIQVPYHSCIYYYSAN
jgi:hypothetical protein